MENLNAEQVKRGLEQLSLEGCMTGVTIKGHSVVHLLRDALALINSQEQDKEKLGLLIDEIVKEKRELFEENKRLTEENERLKAQKYMAYPDGRIEMIPTVESVRADTVRKMRDEINKTLSALCKGDVSEIRRMIDQIAKEMLEEGK